MRTATLVEDFVARGLVVRNVIHLVAQGGEHVVHAHAGAALITQGTMLGDAMPGIVRKSLLEFDLNGTPRCANRPCTPVA